MNRARWVTIARYLLLAVVVGFACFYFWSQWADISLVLSEIHPISLVVSAILVAVGLVFGTASWVTVLNGLGPSVPVLRGAQVLLVGQLGKYVPGSVWSYLMQMELGKQYGILRPRVLVTALYSAGIGIVASLIWGALALPVILATSPMFAWLFLLLPIGLACLSPKVMTYLANIMLRLFRKPPLEHQVSTNVVIRALLWALLSYACYGFHLWFLVNSLSSPNLNELLILTGAIALSFSASVFAFFLPSGLGVREAILISSMMLTISVSAASAVTLVSRGLFTLIDLLAAGVAVVLVLLRRRSLAVETARYLQDEEKYEHRAVRDSQIELDDEE